MTQKFRILSSTEPACIKRPDHLATDKATVVNLVENCISTFELEQQIYEEGVVLYATAPLRSSSDIKEVVSLLKQDGCNFAMATKSFDDPFHQALEVDAYGFSRRVFQNSSQDKTSNEVDVEG